MKRKFEHFLLSILFGTSVLMALTFWLNINFGFNCLSVSHWAQLASLQATGAPINKDFYLSIGVGIIIFILGLYIINRPRFRKIPKMPQPVKNEPVASLAKPGTASLPPVPQPKQEQDIPESVPVQQPIEEKKEASDIPVAAPNGMPLVRPPKLKLPTNISKMAATQYQQQENELIKQQQLEKQNTEIVQIFTDNNYIVKKNPTIGKLKTNLFAIGNNEKIWMGAIDCDIESMQSAVKQLQDIFTETLEDIEIHVNAFILDTLGKYSATDNIEVFHTIAELNEFISKNPGDEIEDYEQDNFNAYSEYIDTVITMLYKA